jgi:hypothetical protein
MIKKTLLILAVIGTTLPAFAMLGETKPQQPKTGTLIEFRQWHLAGSGGSLPFYVNGKLGAKLTNGYYYKLELPEGDYVLTHMFSLTGRDPQKVHVTAGQTIYFRNERNMVTYAFEVAEDQNEAREQVSHLKQQTTQK